jgi:hypothetical protein
MSYYPFLSSFSFLLFFFLFLLSFFLCFLLAGYWSNLIPIGCIASGWFGSFACDLMPFAHSVVGSGWRRVTTKGSPADGC